LTFAPHDRSAQRLIAPEHVLHIEKFDIDGPLLITPTRHGDERGFFSEVFRLDLFEAAAGKQAFVQDNHSLSAKMGTLRGLHFQSAPRAQGKLVRVSRGAVFDVAVDARPGSITFGKHIAVELSARNWRQLFVPAGFLHGFCTLAPDTEFLYKVTDFYSAAHDGSVRWNDPALGIEWPFPAGQLTISEKDRSAPSFAEAAARFSSIEQA
jgi:dTDP-4-dehydrorhamnose 3,5-epimerase